MPTPTELVSQAAAILEQAREMQVQLNRADLDSMSPQQINEARRSGRLDNLLSKEN
jgi:hypothetical protein